MKLEHQIILQTLGELWLVLCVFVIIGSTAQSIKDWSNK
mgnify:FL=1